MEILITILKEKLFDNFNILRNIVLFPAVTYRNILERLFCPPTTTAFIYRIFLPRYNPSFPLSSLSRSERKKPEEDIRKYNTFKLSARNWVGIFYEMYNLAGCTVVLRNLRSRKPHIGPVFRYSVPLSFKILSSLRATPVPCPRISSSSDAHMRRTRRHVSFGDAATWGDLPVECRRSRA